MSSQEAITQTKRPGYDQRLDRMLAGSAKVFSRDGYDKASIRRIAAELGISLSGIYYYVSGKEELLFLIQYRTFSSLVDNLEKKISDVQDPCERIRIMIQNHLEHFVAHMDELVVCTHEIKTLEGDYYDRVLEKRRAYFHLTRAIVSEIQDVYPGSGIDPNLATLGLFGTLNWIYMWYDPVKNASLKNLTDQMTRLFLNGLIPRDHDGLIAWAGNFPNEV